MSTRHTMGKAGIVAVSVVAMLALAIVLMMKGLLPASADTAGVLDHVTITPSPATVVAGAQQQFTAQAFDGNNNALTNATFAWAVINGGGTISATGLLTAGTAAGTFANTIQVVATQGAIVKTATASVAVTPGALDHVAVTPLTATLPFGVTQQFAAQAFDANNNIIAGVTFIWSAVNGGGTISATGLFTAGTTAGTFANTVQASTTVSGVTRTGNASVIVVAPGALDHVVVAPVTATLAAGSTQQFTAQAFDASNNMITAATFTWSVVNSGGTINATGLFTAGATAGTFANTVQASTTVNSITKVGNASVIVTVPGPLDHVLVTPTSATLAPGAMQQFSAQAFDASNNAIPGATFTWSVVNGGGTISATGLFTAGSTAGTFANTAQASTTVNGVTKSGKASVTVASAQPPQVNEVSKQVLRDTFKDLLNRVGFERFTQVEAKFTDTQGRHLSVLSVAGTITALGQNSITIVPNGSTASQTYNVTAQTRFHPGEGNSLKEMARLAVGDRVVITTVNGDLALVTSVHQGQRVEDEDDDDEDADRDNRGPNRDRGAEASERHEGKGRGTAAVMPPGLAKDHSNKGNRHGDDDD